MKNYFFAIIIHLIIISAACQRLDFADPGPSTYNLKGVVQKGPFITGTTLTISELNDKFNPTGRIFIAQISDSKGSFETGNIELVSHYAGFMANGYYFNEVTGQQSESPLTLHAISDLTNKNSVNVNILSTLEKNRVEYLVATGMPFDQSKKQAQDEVLAIFNIEESPKSSEEMDISRSGDENSILLAVSLIMQGFRKEGELSELLSLISNDIRDDGVLNNASLGSELINHARYLKYGLSGIRENLADRYASLGVNAVIPGFESYINNFIDNTKYPVTESAINYPAQGAFGQNILTLSDSVFNGRNFSLSAVLPEGASLKIRMTLAEGDTLGAIWMYYSGTTINWAVTIFDWATKSQEFTSIESGLTCDLNMVFEESYHGKYLLQYFEMGSLIPTRTKIIYVN